MSFNSFSKNNLIQTYKLPDYWKISRMGYKSGTIIAIAAIAYVQFTEICYMHA